MQKALFYQLLCLWMLSSCLNKKSALSGEDEHPAGFKIIKYNNPEAVPDLGTGLWAWPLPMDFDRDGDLDLLVSCPDVPFNGLYLFENPTGDPFPEFNPPVKIGQGYKNLQVSYFEGEPRVLGGEGVEYINFRDSVLAIEHMIYDPTDLERQHRKIRFKQWKWLDWELDGDLDLIVGMDDWGEYGWDNAYDEKGNWTNGPLHGYVYLIENQDGTWQDPRKVTAAGQPVDVYGAPSPNFADFDGDGDLDLICGEFIDRLSWFENIGSRRSPEYADGRFLSNEEGPITMDLQMIIPVAIDWDRDGDTDLIIGDEDGRVAWLEHTGEIRNRMPVFALPRYFRQKSENLKFGALATPVAIDIDNDGDEDIISGNTAGYIGWIENLDGGSPPNWSLPRYLKAGGETIRIQAGSNGSIQGPCESKWGYTTLSVADWDSDGLKDLIVNSIWGKIVWYRNIGSANGPEFDRSQPVLVDWKGTIPKPAWTWWSPEPNHLSTQWRTTPVAIDWNQDSRMDLVMLDHEGYLAFFRGGTRNGIPMLEPGERIFFATNHSSFDSKHRIRDSIPGLLRLNINPNGGSGRRKFCFVDWDGDGDQDLLVNSVNISLLENVRTEGEHTYFTNRGPLSHQKLAGHTTSPTVVDWNKDGRPDLLAGGEDGHFYYLERR